MSCKDACFSSEPTLSKTRQNSAKPRLRPVVLGLLIVFAAGGALLWSRAGQGVRVALLAQGRLIYRGERPARMKFLRKDGMVQVYIPAGEFLMGNRQDKGSGRLKAHMVYLDAYWIDQTEVTNAMYARCVKDGACKRPVSVNPYFGKAEYADHPVVYVSWQKAQDYCRWVGGRLPTEAEWEKAARGTDGRRYPWGNARPTDSLLNFNGAHGQPQSAYAYPTGISPYGLLNMAGNVREWTADWFDEGYYEVSPYKNPQGPSKGVVKSLRGGAYWDDAKQVQTFYRLFHEPASPGENRGFRCVEEVEE